MRKFFVAMLAVAVLQSAATAGYLTTNGDVEVINAVPAAPAPLPDIKTFSAPQGNVWTNSVGPTPVVRTVTAQVINGAVDGIQYNSVALENGTNWVVFSALEGSLSGGLGTLVNFTSGRLFLASAGAGFRTDDPETWAAALGTIFAEYTLGPKEGVIDGFPGGAAYQSSATSMNVATPDAGNSLLSQAVLVFLEDSTAAQNAGATPGRPAGTGGDNFIHNVDSPAVGFTTDEGIVSIADQSILTTLDPLSVSAGDIAVLNAVTGLAGLGDFDEGGYAPGTVGIGEPGFNGDFTASFSSENHIVVRVIPEPSTLAIWGLGLVAAGYAVRRRRK